MALMEVQLLLCIGAFRHGEWQQALARNVKSLAVASCLGIADGRAIEG